MKIREHLERLDESGAPQRLVRWLLARRHKKNAQQIRCIDRREGSHATTLVVASPIHSSTYLVEDYLPSIFGSWCDYKVQARALASQQATLVLREPACGVEFTLVLPRHAHFAKSEFFSASDVRITCEAERARLFSVRSSSGVLLAAGVLEVQRKVAFSRQLATFEPILERLETSA